MWIPYFNTKAQQDCTCERNKAQQINHPNIGKIKVYTYGCPKNKK